MKINRKKDFALRNSKGFTLIELLVVVAIIGILASVVLASLNTARAKGADAAIKSNLANMRAQAALYYDDNNTYGLGISCSVNSNGTISGCTGLFANAQMIAQMTAAAAAAGSTAFSSTDATGEFWAAEVQLKAVPGDYWCVDSTGKSEQATGTAVAATSCP